MDKKLLNAAEALGDALKARKLRLATTESCTAGLISTALGAASASSEFFTARLPGTFHQSPDSLHSALLPAIPQVQMDLAITINATGLQPELFDLSRQSQVYLVALRIRLLKPGVKTTGMNIQHPTEQANRPATGVVTDKGVPQSDSFAKYAAAS